MYALIRRWELGTMTQEQFFREHGIGKSTFGYWRKKYLKEIGSNSKKEKFIPVNVSNPDSGESNAGKIELIYPNGVRLVCSIELNLARLKPLIVL